MLKKLNAKYYLAATIALLTFLVYLPALRNEFVYWDDNQYVFENPFIRSFDAAFFRWAFTTVLMGNWNPLTWISHALDYSLWGLNPLGHHLTNIILHAGNTALVIVLALKLLESARDRSEGNAAASFLTDRTILITGGVTGLLFGIHPVHVESAAWVSERKDLLCALFFLLSVLRYTRYASSRKPAVRSQESEEHENDEARQKNFFVNQHYLLALCFFVLALMSKPMAVSLPMVLLILDWYPLGRIRSWKTVWSAGVEKLPFIALSLASSVMTIMAQKAGGALSSIDRVPLSVRIPVAAKALMAYLGKILLPVNLLPFYPYPRNVSLFSFEYLLAIVLVIGVTAACVVLARKQKLWVSAWSYYVITLLPVLGIVQVGGQAMADRYTYLTSLGPFFVAGVCAAWLWERVKPFARPFCGIVALLLVVFLCYVSIEQIAVWRNSIGLWSRVIEQEPESVPIAYNNRGLVYYKSGQFEMAAEDFQKAVNLRSSYTDAYSNLGMALYRIGMLDEAIENLNNAITLDPAYYKAYNNRAMVLGAMGQFDKAIQDYNAVIALKPSLPQVYYNLGVLYANKGLLDQAIKYFNQSLTVDPGYADAYGRRGAAFFSLGRYDKALDDLNKALAVKQNSPAVYMQRAMLYLKTGRTALALTDSREACDLGDDDGCRLLRELTQELH